MDDFVRAVPLDGFAMHLRRAETESVAGRMSDLAAVAYVDPATLAAALSSLPANDRAPAWELAVRRYGRGKPLELAAAEIGMDLVLARDLLERYSSLLDTVPPADR